MPKNKVVMLTGRAAELLDAYRAEQGGLSYSRAVGRLLGVELPKQGDHWRKPKQESETAQ